MKEFRSKLVSVQNITKECHFPWNGHFGTLFKTQPIESKFRVPKVFGPLSSNLKSDFKYLIPFRSYTQFKGALGLPNPPYLWKAISRKRFEIAQFCFHAPLSPEGFWCAELKSEIGFQISPSVPELYAI